MKMRNTGLVLLAVVGMLTAGKVFASGYYLSDWFPIEEGDYSNHALAQTNTWLYCHGRALCADRNGNPDAAMRVENDYLRLEDRDGQYMYEVIAKPRR